MITDKYIIISHTFFTAALLFYKTFLRMFAIAEV